MGVKINTVICSMFATMTLKILPLPSARIRRGLTPIITQSKNSQIWLKIMG